MSDEKIDALREEVVTEFAGIVSSTLGTPEDRAVRVSSMANRYKSAAIKQATEHEIDPLELTRSTATIDAAANLALRIIAPRQKEAAEKE